jgi:hypothetical protein
VRPPASLLVFVLLSLAYALAGAWTSAQMPARGDEPFYFLAAAALRDGELEVGERARRIEETDYAPPWPIAPEDLARQTAPSFARSGRYPLHDLGLSLLIALPHALGGRPLVVALVGVAMAAAVALGLRAALAVGAPRGRAIAAAIGVGLSAPALTYSGQVYPDAVAPLAVALAMCALAGAAPRWIAGATAAALPLLHLRYWPLTLALLALAYVRWQPRPRAALVLVLPTALLVVALSVADVLIYGIPAPHAGFIAFFLSRSGGEVPAFLSETPAGAIAMFVDRTKGLLSAAPLASLAFVGVGLAARQTLGRVFLAFAAPYLTAVSFLQWSGADSPQGRYLAPLVPLLVVLLALALSWRPTLPAAVALAVWTAQQSSMYVRLPGLRYDDYGMPPAVDLAWGPTFGITPSAAFPLFGGNGTSVPLVALWTFALGALVALGWWAARHRNVTRRPQTRVA